MGNRITKFDFYLAYRKLKSMAYYDSGGLELKHAISQFENEFVTNARPGDSFKKWFEKRISNLVAAVNSVRAMEPEQNKVLSNLIERIGYRLVPKSFSDSKQEEKPEGGGRLITNDNYSDRCHIEKYNVMIEAPVEIHIVSVLWLMKVAVLFDSEIPDNNYANRFSSIDDSENENDVVGGVTSGLMLFRPYFKGYQDWRDRGLGKAISILNEGHDCALLSLDIRRYYYSVRMNVLNAFKDRINTNHPEYRLTKIIHVIHKKYAERTRSIGLLAIDDDKYKDGKFSLPVGLPSSAWLANWYLVNFDRHVLENINPEYYGRYVDDLIFVFRCNGLKGNNDGERVQNFIKKKFIDTGVLSIIDHDYAIDLFSSYLYIQQDKVILEYFRHDASRAAINKFKKNIDRNRSEFRYLPFNSMVDVDFDDEAFSLEYTDSVNKLRSLKSLSENKFGASTYLANKIFLALFPTSSGKRDKRERILSARQMLTFFRGRTALVMYQLWEKVATYFLLTSDYKNLMTFYGQAFSAIDSISVKIGPLDAEGNEKDVKNPVNNDEIQLIKDTLKNHLLLSFAMPFSLCPLKMEEMTTRLAGSLKRKYVSYMAKEIIGFARQIRRAHLFRHNYLRVPGLGYTEYNDGESDLTERPHGDSALYSVLTSGGESSPVFLHFHDLNLLEVLAHIGDQESTPSDLLKKVHDSFYKFNYSWRGLKKPERFCKVSIRDGNSFIDVEDVQTDDDPVPVRTDKKIGIVNWFVDPCDCEAAIRGDFLLRKEHQEKLFEILNYANRHKVELMALPELAVPVEQLGLLVRQCCRQDMAIISGINYIVRDGKAYNYIVTILPVRTKYYTTCVIIPRIKNYPAPSESEWIEGLRFQAVSPTPIRYDLFHWRKVYFSVYNCFEMSNISDRALFKSKVDFVVAAEYNKDTNYYSNVVESWARDLHCYILQVNTSEFGDSRVVQPTAYARKNIMSISGGTEPLLLIDTLGIEAIRDFQEHAYNWQINPAGENGRFKPTPPKYEYRNTLHRRKNRPLDSNDW